MPCGVYATGAAGPCGRVTAAYGVRASVSIPSGIMRLGQRWLRPELGTASGAI